MCTGTSYTRIEGIDYPCGTTRPISYTARMDFTATPDDLNNFVVASYATNANVDTIHSVKLFVYYTLPDGCELLDDNGNPVVSGSGTIDALNTYIVGQKKPIEVFGNLTIEPPCNDVPFTDIFCLGADLPTYGLVTGDFVQQIGLADCNGNILGGSYYTLDLTEIDEPVVIDANCVTPEVKEVLSCVEDKDGNQWQQIVILLGFDVLSTYYLNTSTLETSLDIGSFEPCPLETTNFTKNKTCAFIDGEQVSGYEISYIQKGKMISVFEYLDGTQVTDYEEFCCDDCVQYAGCFDPRLVRFNSVTFTDGTTIDLDAIYGLDAATSNNVITEVTNLAGGTGQTGNIFNGDFSGCTSIDTWEFQFTNVSKQIQSITTNLVGTLNFSSFGRCSFSSPVLRIDETNICADGGEAIRIAKYDQLGNRVELIFEKTDGTQFTPTTFDDCGGGINVTTNDVGVLFAFGQQQINTSGQLF